MYVAWLVLLTLFDLSTVGAAEVVADVMVVSACAEAPKTGVSWFNMFLLYTHKHENTVSQIVLGIAENQGIISKARNNDENGRKVVEDLKFEKCLCVFGSYAYKPT